MSTREMIEDIKEEKPPVECFFCIDRNKHRFSHFTPLTDKFIREYFAKDGITECNHDEMDEASIWFADFMARSLLQYVMDNYLERQTDEEFKDKTLRNGAIMIPAMQKKMEDQYNEFPLECFGESDRPRMKAQYDKMPKWIDEAKRMYQVN